MDEDQFLYVLVDFAEKGLHVPITLSVGGTLVAGDTISEEQYFEESGKLIRYEQPDDEEYLQELFGSMSSTFDSVAMKFLDAGEDPDDVRKKREKMAKSFVHLKDTYIMSSGEHIGMESTFFRCKLRAVDGFWLGRAD